VDLQLSGQTAVIVGSARGIGRAIAEAFAAEGAHLVLVDRSPAVTATAGQIGGRTLPIIADVSDYGSLQRGVEQVLSTYGRIDHVVFAVGIGSGKYGFPFWNLEPTDWSRVLEVNVVGAVNVAHVFTATLV
jgi:2-hydroxycyclohexanecarboxyl-CoA dehydrogenase